MVVLIGVPLLLLTIALLYLNFANLGGWRDTVGRLATRLMGRELLIKGDFELDVGFTTRLVASDITLANPPWSDDPEMASVDHLAGEIDLLSFLFGPMTIHNVEITGARALFELGSEGRFNWSFSDGEPGTGGGGDVELVISHALIRDLRVVYTSPQGQALEAELSKLEFTDEGGGMLDLDLVGSIGGTPLEVSGRLGTFVGLINAAAVEHDLTGRFADAEFTFRGTIDDLSSLTGVDEEVSASGPDLQSLGATFGLDPEIDGPFSVNVSLRPSASATDFKLEAAAGGINARITGFVDSLTEPSILDAAVKASGPSIRTVGTLTGVTDLPEEEFSVSGGIRWDGFPIQVKKLEISVGDNSLSADGVLGAPPRMLGTDFTIQGQGPNASSLGALVGVDLPREKFSVGGRLVRVEGGLQVDQVEAHIGPTTFEVDGTVGDPPDYEGTALDIQGSGPNLAIFEDLAGVALPAEPFEVDGEFSQGEGAIDVEAVRAHLGRNTLQMSGRLVPDAGLVGSDLRLSVAGPDASQLADIADIGDVPEAPHEAFAIDGRVRILEDGYRVNDLEASVGSLAVRVEGFVAPPPTFIGSDLQIHIEDSDLSHPASIAGIEGLPRDPFRIDTRLQIQDPGYRLDDLRATVGDMALEVGGRIGALPALEGTRVRISARVPSLSSLNPYLKQSGLPDAPFSVSGNVHFTDGAFSLDSVVAEVDENRIALDGTVQTTKGLVGTDLEISISSSDLGRAGGLAVEFADIPALPAEPFSLAAHLRIDEGFYEIGGLRATLGDAVASMEGRIGSPPDLIGTDLTIDSDGPNASLFSSLTGVTMPIAPVQLSGRVERNDAGFRFHGVTARLGEYRAAIDGTFGKLPKLIGTDLEVHASGPGTALIRELAGLADLPDQPFVLHGKFRGTPELFATRDFSLTFGPNDIEGSFAVDITGKPTVEARLTSTHLDLSRLREWLKKKENVAQETADSKPPVSQKSTRVIPDKALNLAWLSKADADVVVRIDDIVLAINRLHDVAVNLRLAEGRLEIERMTATGLDQGSVSGNLVLEPAGNRYRLGTRLEIRRVRLDLPGTSINPADQPPVDINIDLEARGANPHELASSSNGSVQVVIGKGVMDNRALDLVTADILLTLLKSFNPFAKEDAATELQCAVVQAIFENGVARLEPMAFQSDRMTMLGKGKIDLGTEKIDLEWVTKPRKGTGISASMITNPYIKLGGTLSNPTVQLKGMEAVASTGVAVATFGVSLVAKGMYDRVTAEKKVCQQALEEIGSRTGGSTKKPKKKK